MNVQPPLQPQPEQPRVCACGHDEARHEHYRPGTDCSVPGCGCRGFGRSFWEVLRDALARFRT